MYFFLSSSVLPEPTCACFARCRSGMMFTFTFMLMFAHVLFMLSENENGHRLDMETDMDTDMTGHKHSKNQVSDVRPDIDLKNMIPYRT